MTADTGTAHDVPIDTWPPNEDRSFDHGAISRFNAWFFTAFAGVLNHLTRPHKAAAFANIDSTTVLEIGAGTGGNLHHLRPGTKLYAVEPNRRMEDRLRRRAESAAIGIIVLPTGAESIPLPDASIDEVICSLVLCTVDAPDVVLAEVRRVLRPGGRFRFVEHVAAPAGARSLVQRALRRPWRWLFEGCDLHRDTPSALERAGFSSVEIRHRKLRHSPFWPVNTAIWGIATR